MLRPDFFARHNTRYTREIRQSSVKDQCGLGTCHLHSWVSQLETDYRARTGRGIKLSTHYLSVVHWFESTIRTLTSDTAGVETSLGMDPVASQWVMLRRGLMPDVAWQGSRIFQERPLANRMTEYLRNIVARTKAQNRAHPQKRQENIERAIHEIDQVFDDFVGGFSPEFTYNNRRYTPDSFREAFFPDLGKPVVYMWANSGRREKTSVQNHGYYTHVNTGIDVLERTAKTLIDQGQSVYVGYENNTNFITTRDGIMSIAAFNMPRNGRPLSRTQRASFDIHDGGHAVQIVGYDQDPTTGRIIKWKVKNSWGRLAGDQGYYHMYNDFFRAFVSSLTFYRNDRIPLPANEVPPSEQLELNFGEP